MKGSSKNLLKFFAAGFVSLFAAQKAVNYAYKTGVSEAIEKHAEARQKGEDLNEAYDKAIYEDPNNKSNRHGG